MAERVLVTGIRGCLGAWTARALLDAGHEVVGYDLGHAHHRLALVLGEDAAALSLVAGDVTDMEALGRTLDDRSVTRVVHLAALQLPFVRADPVLGARVNVAGTAAVFEAVRARLDRIPGVVYASSAAVYGPDDPSPAPEAGGGTPATHYGVHKLANEQAARVYWSENGLASIGVRPVVVYGPGRDQGLTSAPTLAMAAAARGEGAVVGFAGSAQYDYAPDVGWAFARAAVVVEQGALVGTFPGITASVEEVAAAIEAAASGARVTSSGPPLPFPAAYETRVLDDVLGAVPRTPLAEGVAATIERFRATT